MFVVVGLVVAAGAADAPPQSVPRATLGDSVVEPAWEQRLTITVGPANADLVGTNEKAIQAAVDYIARFGGGKPAPPNTYCGCLLSLGFRRWFWA